LQTVPKVIMVNSSLFEVSGTVTGAPLIEPIVELLVLLNLLIVT